jgi:hypothetical protein
MARANRKQYPYDHAFTPREGSDRFVEHLVRWTANCATCGATGYLVSGPEPEVWRHRPNRQRVRELRRRDLYARIAR